MLNAYFTIGLPGSGKSTWIKENIDCKIISADDHKHAINFDLLHVKSITITDVHKESVKRAADELEKTIETGEDFCMDGGGVNTNYTFNLVSKSREAGYKIHIVHFDTPVEVCIARNNKRNRTTPVPNDQIIDKSIIINKCLAGLLLQADNYIPVRYYKNEHMFFDMDGTLAAYQHIPLDQYGKINFTEGEYFRYAAPVYFMIEKARLYYEKGRNIKILSAAPDDGCVNEKVDWLAIHCPFIQRENMHFIGNKAYKQDLVRNVLKRDKIPLNHAMVIDDDHKVLQSLNEIGINGVHPSMFLASEH